MGPAVDPASAIEPAADLDRLLDPRELRPAYQPIVDLTTHEVVGYEALARWPLIDGADPAYVFGVARRAQRVHELDDACRTAAIAGARTANLGPGRALFVNIEPAALESALSVAALGPQLVHDDLRVVIELTERSLPSDPAELVALVAWARREGLGIALDDGGVAPETLALLPFLAPDVVKLDMSLIQHRPNRAQAAIMGAVLAYAERTGATILAEGIETMDHLDQAQALGATLGQGWMFGRPGPIHLRPIPTAGLGPRREGTEVPRTPFSLVADHPRLRTGRKSLLQRLSFHIEAQGRTLIPPPVILSSFQSAERFTAATARRYEAMVATAPLVGALGAGMGTEPAPGVRGASLAPGDPLAEEWTVVVVGPHYAGALIARDLGDRGPEGDRRFAFLVTHDIDLVAAAARSLMVRITWTKEARPRSAPAGRLLDALRRT